MLKNYHKIIALLLLIVTEVVSAKEPLVFGVHPYLPALEIQEKFSPLVDYLSKSIERNIVIKVSPSYQTHIERIVKGEIDIAYLGPASFVKAYVKEPELEPLARLEVNGEPVFYGKIVTRKGSGINKLDDLKGKSFAFGDKNSTMSHLVPRYALIQHGLMDELVQYKFLGSHKNVALGILFGQYDAGAIKEGVYLKYKKRGLQLIQNTEAISEHLFVASTKMSESWHVKVKEGLLNLNADGERLAILQTIKPSITNLVKVKSSDYDNLRKIIHELKVLDNK